MTKFLPLESHCYESREKLNLHYFLRKNPESSHCCLLLHGFTNDAHIFDALADQLQASCNVIALDFRGHGDSDWDEQANYQHEDLIRDVLLLIAQYNFTDWHIIGHSLGARVALLATAQHALPLKSLTIIDTGPEVNATGVRKVRRDAENTPKTFADTHAFFEYLSAIYFLAAPERLRHIAEHGLKTHQGKQVAKTDPAFTRALWQQDARQDETQHLRAPKQHDLWESLSTIQCPCLVVRGQASAILTQSTAEKMIAHLTQAKLVVVPSAGHALMLDNANFFEAACIDFLKQYL